MGLKIQHLIDPRISNSHTSFIEAAWDLAAYALKDSRITKIAAGAICRGRRKMGVKFHQNPAGIVAEVSAGGNKQILHIYVVPGAAYSIIESLQQFFNKNLPPKERRCGPQNTPELFAPSM